MLIEDEVPDNKLSVDYLCFGIQNLDHFMYSDLIFQMTFSSMTLDTLEGVISIYFEITKITLHYHISDLLWKGHFFDKIEFTEWEMKVILTLA